MYIGGLVEKVTVGTTVIWRHYIAGGTGTVAVYTRRNTGVDDIHYLTHDHLGSVASVTSGTGAVEMRASFGAFGQRRNEAGWNGSLPSADWTGIASTTRHGFTDHEMLDNLRLVHMNGRVYDSGVGEFLSPDPFVPAPAFTQSFNRYSYVFNDPLSFTDPSGFEPTWDEKLPWLWADWEQFFGDPTDQALERIRVFDHILRNWQSIATTQNDPKQWEAYIVAHADAVVTERESSLPGGGVGGVICSSGVGGPCHSAAAPLPHALHAAYRITDAIADYLNREPTLTLPDGRQVPVATGTVLTPGIRSAASGTATLIQHVGRHASVAIRVGDEILHTEQFLLAGRQTTIVAVEGAAPAVRELTIGLPDAAAAMNYQRAILGQSTGLYNAATNSCVTHCGDVLRAGGLNVPSTTREIIKWLNTLGY